MWGNLAGRVAENLKDSSALRSTISRIGEAVAPPLQDDDDEEYEYYTDEEEEYEEEEYYEEEEEEEVIILEEDAANAETQHHANHYSSKPDVVAVGRSLLQQALDDEEAEHQAHMEQHGKEYVKRDMMRRNQRPMLPLDNDDDDEEEEVETTPVLQAHEPEKAAKIASDSLASVVSNFIHPFPKRDEPVGETTSTATTTTEVNKTDSTVLTKESLVKVAPPPDSLDMLLSASAASGQQAVDSDTTMKRGEIHPVPDTDRNDSREKEISHAQVPLNKGKVVENDATLALQKKNDNNAMTSKDSFRDEEEEEELHSISLCSSSPKVDPPKNFLVGQQPPHQQEDKLTKGTLTANAAAASIMATPKSPRQATASSSPKPSLPKASRQAKPGHLHLTSTTSGDVAAVSPTRATTIMMPREDEEDEKNNVVEATTAVTKSTPIPPPLPPLLPSTDTSTVTNNNHSTVATTTKETKKHNDSIAHPPPHDNNQELLSVQKQCKTLQEQLGHAERHIVELQQDAARRMDEEEQWRSQYLQQLQQEQARMMEAATEAAQREHALAQQQLQESHKRERLQLERALQEERELFQKQGQEYQRLLEEARARVEAAESQQSQALARQEAAAQQAHKRKDRALQVAEDKLAQTMALLDERNDQVKSLKAEMKELKATVHEHREGAVEAEEEMDELHLENETLRQNVSTLEAERAELHKQVDHLQSQVEKMGGLQMEMRLLREERDRERAKNQSAAVSAESSQAELESERDAARALARDLEHQLTAALADLELARSDTARVMMANENLQNALEAFQSERETEMELLEEQRRSQEEANAAAHAAAIEATHEANELRIREVQAAADAAVKNTLAHAESLEIKVEEYRKENIQMRRSLDEAISRLQTTQEDVIDRMLMKNILLDWFAKSGKAQRDVLEVMASLLHFSEEEKNKIHIGDGNSGRLGKMVGAVAAPLPPSKADLEHLQGDTVREKWVSFLLAEAGEEDEKSSRPTENGGPI